MRRVFVWSVLLLCAACVGRSPTSPENGSVRASGQSRGSQPSRPGTRVVAPRPAQTAVPLGIWGGDHVNLMVTGIGGTLEYDCAHGTIDQPLVADGEGRFELAGTHTREHGGPIREGEKADKRPARYSGTTDGRTMTLTVTLTDSGVEVGTFSLTRGQAGRVVKCL